jgi:serine/threonine protein kinase
MPDTEDNLDGILRAAAAAPPIPTANVIGERFDLIRRLGEGTFGVVYEATDRRDGKRVALKLLRDPRAEWIHRIKREFRALHDLHHTNLVALEELFCVGERWFFTMELLDGINIVDYTRRGARFDEARLRSAFGQLMAGLAAFHATGRVHRDIKPSNVLVTREHRTVLLDFGLTTEADTTDELASAIVGTPAYMAPEQAAGRAVGPAADQYAAGVLLFEILVGHRPGGTPKILIETNGSTAPDDRVTVAVPSAPPSITRGSFPPSCPPDLVECCLALLDRDPVARPSAAAVAARLGDTRIVEPLAPVTQPIPLQLLIGRDSELAVLEQARGDVAGGELVSIVVHGESGIGKTALVRQFLDAHRSSDQHLVLTGRCYEKESVPFKAFDEIVDSISGHLLRQSRIDVAELIPRQSGYLRLLFPVIGRVEGFDRLPQPRKDISDPTELRHRAFSALRDLFVGLAERRTVIVHIDDLHWADQDSVLLLSRLLAPPVPPRMLLLATSRKPIDLAALGIDGSIRTIELQPLDRENAALLTQQLLSPSTPEAQLANLPDVIEQAHGHPYFIMELVRHMRRTSGKPGTRPSLDEAIWVRVLGEDATAQLILKYVSVSGAPIDPDALRATVDLPVQEFRRHCSHLTRELLIRSTDVAIVPYHDRVREAVIANLSDAERRQLHARLATVFAKQDDLALQVHHLEASGQQQEAARVAVAAARKARNGLAFEQATTFFRFALATTTGVERGDLLIEYGSTLVAMGRGREASDVYTEAAEVAALDKRLACQIESAHQLLTGGYLLQGTLKIRELFAEQGMSYPATPLYALLRIAARRVAAAFRDPRRLPVQRRAPTASDRAKLALYRAAVQGLVLVDPIRAAFCVGNAVRLAREIGDVHEYFYFLLLEGDLRMAETSRKRSGTAVVTAFDALARQRPDVMSPTLVAVHKGARVFMNMRGGDSEALDSLVKADEQLARDRNAPWELVGGRSFLLSQLRRLGRYAELKQRYTHYRLDAGRRTDVYAEATMRGFCNLLHLVDDDPRRAREELSTTIWIALEHGFHVQHWYEFNALVEVHLYEREAPSSAYLAQQLAAFTASRLAILAVFAIETEWLVGRVGLAFPHLFGPRRIRAAIRKLERTDAPYPRLLAMQLRAGVAYTTNNPAQAVAELETAIQIGKSLDMKIAPALASYRLGALTGGDDGAAMRERARATLASEGVRDVDRFVDLMLPGFAPKLLA